jgi:hypothetical protein
MDNVTYETVTNFMTGEEVEYVTIDHGNDQYTSMLKSAYDEQQAQAALSTPMVADAPKS